MQREYFSKETRLADIINANRNIILLLPRFGIELGFGEKSLQQVCDKHCADADMFLLICNLYTFEGYTPTVSELKSINVQSLLNYLTASHKYYSESRIPHIAQHLDHLSEYLPQKEGKLIQRFYQEYQDEVMSHFQYEESTLFPYIQELIIGKRSDIFTIQAFESNHTNIEDKLSDLKNIMIKYLPGNLLNEDGISVLFDLFRLADDISKHTLIEDKILTPYVEQLEKSEL